jgi:hypothetical protein
MLYGIAHTGYAPSHVSDTSRVALVCRLQLESLFCKAVDEDPKAPQVGAPRRVGARMIRDLRARASGQITIASLQPTRT